MPRYFGFSIDRGVRRKFKSLAGRLIDVAETGINELVFWPYEMVRRPCFGRVPGSMPRLA